MPFKLNAFLPSKNQEVQVKELTYRQYRALVKSLYSTQKKESVLQYNSVLYELCPDIINEDITFEDKLSLLLYIRNYCVSPDLKLKITEPNGNIFNYSVTIDNLIERIKGINKSGVIELEDMTISYSSYKARDEYVFNGNNKDISVILASYVDTLEYDSLKIYFKNYTLEDRVRMIDSLPYPVISALQKKLIEVETKFEELDFLVITKPFEQTPVLKVSQNITFEVLQQVIGYLFTEDLTNVYRALYNMVQHAGFSAEYIDSITPVEVQVYWMYFMEEQKKKTESSSAGPGLNLPQVGSVPNPELGF